MRGIYARVTDEEDHVIIRSLKILRRLYASSRFRNMFKIKRRIFNLFFDASVHIRISLCSYVTDLIVLYPYTYIHVHTYITYVC